MMKSSLISLLMISLLVGCSKIPKLDKVLPDSRTEYKKSTSLPDLEVPPDLTTEAIKDRMAIPSGGDTATYSTFQERAAQRQREEQVEKAQTDAIRLIENEHILAVNGAPVQVWPKLREFWSQRGYTLELDDEELGVVETNWYEDQQELTRDRFKIFAEAGGDAGTTLLYISHRGEQLVPKGDSLVWQPRERDMDLERRLVERLQEHLTGKPAPTVAEASTREEPAVYAAQSPAADDAPVAEPRARAAGNARAELMSAGQGKVYLTLQEEFSAAWKITGRALGRVGVTIDQEDRSRGVYYVRLPGTAAPADKKGVWSKLKFWDRAAGEIHQISLTGVGDKTEVVVLNEDGKWETTDQAGQLLSRLHDEFNSGQI